MSIGGSTCGAKFGGYYSNEEVVAKSLGGGVYKRGVPKKKVVRRRKVVRRGGEGVEEERAMYGNKEEFMNEQKMEGGRRRVVRRRVVRRGVVRRGGEGEVDKLKLEEFEDNKNKIVSGGAKKKKRVLTPYNKFVKKHFPKIKEEHPSYKAVQIMKKIAMEWKKISN